MFKWSNDFLNVVFFFFLPLQKRHNADSVVNKKECQGTEKKTFLLLMTAHETVVAMSSRDMTK